MGADQPPLREGTEKRRRIVGYWRDLFGGPTDVSDPSRVSDEINSPAAHTADGQGSGEPVESGGPSTLCDSTEAMTNGAAPLFVARHARTDADREPGDTAAVAGTGEVGTEHPDEGPDSISLVAQHASTSVETSADNVEQTQEQVSQPPVGTGVARTVWPLFGPAAALRPYPMAPAAQTTEWYVDDTALDWFDMDQLHVRGASVRGHMHRYENSVRQDSFALGHTDDFVILVLCDGVGSAPMSHVGARSAAAFAACWGGFASRSRALLSLGAETSQVPLAELHEHLMEVAAHMGLEPSDLAATLVMAAIERAAEPDGDGSRRAVLWNVGDSAVLRIGTDGSIGAETPPVGSDDADQTFANAPVSAVPMATHATVWLSSLAPGETLMIASDGVSNIVASNTEFCDSLADLWRTSAPTPAQLLQVVDATVKSFDDDRTVVGIRLEEAP